MARMNLNNQFDNIIVMKGQHTTLGEYGMTKKLTLEELERFLWQSADILRGSIDSSDYKNYIFGLLFLKRLSDVFEEEAEKLLVEGGSPEVAWEDPDEHQFFIPKRARWNEIRKQTTDIGATINKANEALEEQNPKLEKVLTTIDYNDKDRLSDHVLMKLVNHFSQHRLRNSDLEEPDLLGRAYEYLIKQFADDAGKKGGEFYTPQKVVQLIVNLLQSEEGMRIYDPCCGSGGMLIESHKYIEDEGGNPQNISLYGQELNINTWAICKMNMLLHNVLHAFIERGDTMLNPKFLEGDELMLFDRVVANPMWNQKEWGREVLIDGDRYGRFPWGIPSKSSADWAWIQHMLASLTVDGKMGIVLDNGVLFRGGAEGKIRQQALEADVVECCIALPSNLFYNTSSPGSIVILNKKKTEERMGKVLFIYGEKDYHEGKAQNFLRDEDIQKIMDAYSKFENIEKFAYVATLDEVEENDFNLNIPRYVDITELEEEIDVAHELKVLRKLEQERKVIEERMGQDMKELGFE